MCAAADLWLRGIPEHLLGRAIRDSIGVIVALDGVLPSSAVDAAVLYGPGCDGRTDVLLPCMCVGPGSRVGDLQPGSDGDGASVHLSDRVNGCCADRRWWKCGIATDLGLFEHAVRLSVYGVQHLPGGCAGRATDFCGGAGGCEHGAGHGVNSWSDGLLLQR